MRLLRSFIVSVSLVAFAVAPAAQSKPAPPTRGAVNVSEATDLTNGWALLTEGRAQEAIARADRILAASPRSAAAFVLAIEAELSRGGSMAALARYERWIGQSTLEEPLVLRRIATGALRELANGTQAPGAKLVALEALALEGDAAALAALQQRAGATGLGEARALARLGDERAVKVLIADLKQTAGRSVSGLEALGASGSASAVAPVAAQLTSALPEVRAAAVEALGRLGTRHNTVAPIKPLLKDSTPYVRYKAAAALFALGDTSGLGILQEMAAQESPSSRLMAAQALATQPSAEWQELVKQLTAASQPEIRVGAARLLLPHQPELATSVLQAASADPNPAIREMATESIIDALAPNNLRMLRQMLQRGTPEVRARAAARILALLR